MLDRQPVRRAFVGAEDGGEGTSARAMMDHIQVCAGGIAKADPLLGDVDGEAAPITDEQGSAVRLAVLPMDGHFNHKSEVFFGDLGATVHSAVAPWHRNLVLCKAIITHPCPWAGFIPTGIPLS